MVSLLALIELTYRLREVPIVVIVATFGLLILNYAVLILLESSSKYGKSVHDNALYRQQLETEINNVKILMKSFESQAQCIHDHKQHLATIYQLIYTRRNLCCIVSNPDQPCDNRCYSEPEIFTGRK